MKIDCQRRFSWAAALASLALVSRSLAAGVNPYPRAIVSEEPLRTWTFADGAEGWAAAHDCGAVARGGALHLQSTGSDPYLIAPFAAPAGHYRLAVQGSFRGRGGGAVYWLTRGTPWGEDKVQRFPILHDGAVREQQVEFEAQGDLTHVRIDPGTGPGAAEIHRVTLIRLERHPLEITELRSGVGAASVEVMVTNHLAGPVAFDVNGIEGSVIAGGAASVAVPAAARQPFECLRLCLRVKGLPDLVRSACLYHPQVAADWAVVERGALRLRVAEDGSGALVERNGTPVAILHPLIEPGAVAVAASVTTRGNRITVRAGTCRVDLRLRKDEIHLVAQGEGTAFGPAVRALGSLREGVFAGLEYLGEGEASSSSLDIENAERLRFRPERWKVTMPLMAFVTDRACVAMGWDDMRLQPVYATPNFFDGTPDHLMRLEGERVEAVIRVSAPCPVTDAVLWAVRRRGLPAVPRSPRTPAAQRALCLTAITGPLRGTNGWGHAADDSPRWPRRCFADIASGLWRLTGDVPSLPELVPGGAHVPDPAIYLLSGRTQEWLALLQSAAAHAAQVQGADGSYRHTGPYQRGHFEDTASGVNAGFALTLLEHARVTGDPGSLAAAERTLRYLARFRTPRGAQLWEIPLHTPDLLASASCALACVRGYELTGRREYLDEARRWALTGVPFVYQWDCYPVMRYGTTCVFGATDWRAPVWIGRPVQWVGLVYARALLTLAEHDRTLDWRRLAEGIVVAGEQMQAKDGPFVGCLADSLELPSQELAGPWINPCTLIGLRQMLEGAPYGLDVAADGRHRVASPFPVAIRGGDAVVRAARGVRYQVVIDGARCVDVISGGSDRIPLRPPPAATIP